MPLHIRPATEADIAAVARLGAAAFDPATDHIAANMFPAHLQPGGRPTPDAQIAWRVARKTAEVASPHAVLMLAVDDEAEVEDEEDRIVGFALWDPPVDEEKAKEAEEASSGAAVPWAGPEMDPEAVKVIKARLQEGATRLFGERGTKDVWYCDFLGVHPRHQRRGIGKMLLAWGLEKAASEGRDCYLVATPAGRPLYLAVGFEEVGAVDMFGVPHGLMIVKNDPRWKQG